MSKREHLVASLPHGPRDPVTGTPPRHPGSVRRTTAIEQGWDDAVGPLVVHASGRDLLTRADGSTEVLDRAVLHLELGDTGTVAAVRLDPPHAGLAGLVGASARSGFRSRAAQLAPEHRDRATVLHQLLDDVPLASLIAGYGLSRANPDFDLPTGTAERLADLCAGWARGATMLEALDATGIFPVPVGPPAPALTDGRDPLAWHDLEPLAPGRVRRVRRLDLVAGDPLALDVHFRDTHHGAEGTEEVLHEYTLQATIDAGSLTVRSAQARARTLPWPECPNAVPSAARVVGQPVTALRDLVAASFEGTSTCTHLNDLLRSLAGVDTLAQALT